MIEQKILDYVLEVIEIDQFKSYYYENIMSFTALGENSFLKALDIPPKFYKEQPEETQKELIENRETFVREHDKYFNKVIVVLKDSLGTIMNACRMDQQEELSMYEVMSTINECHPGMFKHRSFIKDGYVTLVAADNLVKGSYSKAVVIDLPILMNKPLVVHRALFQIPTESSVTPVDHIKYVGEATEVNFLKDSQGYTDAKDVVSNELPYLSQIEEGEEVEQILREPEVVSLALVEDGVIPKAQRGKVEKHIEKNVEGILTTDTLENLVLDFDETFKSYKQVTNLRNVNGTSIIKVLNSDSFKELTEELEELVSV